MSTELMTTPRLADVQLSDEARDYIRAARAKSTERAYRSHVAAWSMWCEARGVCPCPAKAREVAEYISERARRATSIGRQLSPGSIRATLSALAYAHKLAAHAFDTATFSELMSGVARTHGGGKRGKAALETVELVPILDRCPATLQGRRDRALLSLGFAAALRRSELVGLDVSPELSAGATGYVAFSEEGLEVSLVRSKTDQIAKGARVFVPKGMTEHCAVAALRAWVDELAVLGIVAGPLFLPVGKGNKLKRTRLTPQSVRLVVRARAEDAALARGMSAADAAKFAERFAGHSLRSGCLTAAAKGGASVWQLRDHARHADIRTTSGYVRLANGFRESAAGKCGL
jgi:integrase